MIDRAAKLLLPTPHAFLPSHLLQATTRGRSYARRPRAMCPHRPQRRPKRRNNPMQRDAMKRAVSCQAKLMPRTLIHRFGGHPIKWRGAVKSVRVWEYPISTKRVINHNEKTGRYCKMLLRDSKKPQNRLTHINIENISKSFTIPTFNLIRIKKELAIFDNRIQNWL